MENNTAFEDKTIVEKNNTTVEDDDYEVKIGTKEAICRLAQCAIEGFGMSAICFALPTLVIFGEDKKDTFHTVVKYQMALGALSTVCLFFIDIQMAEQKQVVNALCHSGIDTIVSAACITLCKKFLKFKSPDAGKFSLEDMGLITVSVAAADMARQYAVKKGWIPENLNV